MEKVQKVVKDVSPFGNPDEHGNQGYWVNFEDGSKGTFRTPNNDLFIAGQSAEFSIREMRKSEKAGDYAILQRYKEPYNPSGSTTQTTAQTSKSSENIEQINRSVAIKAAAEFHAQSTVDREYVVETADIFYDYIRFGIKDSETGPPPEELKTPQTASSDGLPF